MSDKNKLKQETKNALVKLTNSAFAKQLAGGTAAGLVAGVLVGKVGKTAALAAGGSILLYEIAYHKGYITWDWNKLKEKTELESKFATKQPVFMNKMKTFAGKNKVFTAGFVGGLLIGMSTQ